jgi:hypothetical protein
MLEEDIEHNGGIARWADVARYVILKGRSKCGLKDHKINRKSY